MRTGRNTPACFSALVYQKKGMYTAVLTDLETIRIVGIARNTYYKYKRELEKNTLISMEESI